MRPLIAIGEVIMEPMTPARVANLRNESVKRFHDRFGQHLHSIAFYFDDVAQISAHLGQHRLRQFDVTGKSVTPPNEKFAVGRIRAKRTGNSSSRPSVPTPSIRACSRRGSNEYWRERNPLGIERASHITAVVGDLSAAKKFYVEVLGAKLIDERSIANRKQSAFVAVG